MVDTVEDSVIPGDDATGMSQPSAPATPDNKEPDPRVKAFVDTWSKKIKAAKKHHSDAFKRMRKCMQLAKSGHDKEWGEQKYSVPIVNRIVNQAVAALYARNPRALARRKRRRMSTVWDGQLTSLQEAGQAIAAAQQTGLPPDPNFVAILKDAEQVKQYDILADGIADTLTLLTQHFVDDPAAMYKQLFKALVRRVKVTGVGYVRLSFERVLEPTPDAAAHVATLTEQVATLRQLIAEKSREKLDDESAEMEQLRTLLQSLDTADYDIVKEGPLFTFPKSTSIIIDPDCFHLKTLAGARWYAEEWDKTPDEIERLWKVDVRGKYTTYKADDTKTWERITDDGKKAEEPGKVWRVMNRDTGQEFVICEGYPDYLVEPRQPEVKLARFWDIFPLVFNEIEDDDDIFPPSDVWNARHIQAEYNRSREGLREHRQQNRPAYISGKGSWEETDLDKLENHRSGEIVLLNQLQQNEKVADKLQAKPVMQIDPKMYDVTENWNDLLRVVGTQQADLGPTSKATATESTIAEQGRQSTNSDLTDDIDDMLSCLFQATGEVMLKGLSPDTVKAIVGPGAVWPEQEVTRAQICEEIILSSKGGSSGRPNQAADLAKLERAMPYIIQLPGVKPTPIAEKYFETLDIDAEDTIVEGLPSIVALNGMLQRSTGNPATDPNAQGPQGVANAPQPGGNEPGPQGAMPAPIHFDTSGNPMNGGRQ
jgi:hypothetical protein